MNRKKQMKNTDTRVFVYWEGKKPALISLLLEVMQEHLKGRDLHILNDATVADYLDLPSIYWDLSYTHKADYLRVNLIYHYGGIWLDADTLVMNDLAGLFTLLQVNEGFLLREDRRAICNGVFGAKKQSELLARWAEDIDHALKDLESGFELSRTSLGSKIINELYETTDLADEFTILEGLDTIYPVNWDKCVEVYLNSTNHDVRRTFQDVIVLVNSVYKETEKKSRRDLVTMNNVLGSLLRESMGWRYSRQKTRVNNRFRHTKTLAEFLKMRCAEKVVSHLGGEGDSFDLEVQISVQGVASEFYMDSLLPSDVVIVPKALATDPNVSALLHRVSQIDAEEYIFAVPDALQLKRNYYYDHSNEAVELIDPDAICWYSPYTLSNLISHYSDLKIKELLYVKNRLVALCEK